ncbi:uncharacterized protein LOC116853974 isoform X2 [Odontomachus brunneus]|uniref:uncharacterized protein LOC116853961 isoform X2 n=1 Tax=Odontomachus brunneus TaxID=486640 RepID=UPI0013F1E65D|nr:uncharacterized protein LOC116853961 isoform X2 [Odontomachus brunneus]XP_032691276.1 uncharacterized protein LOC116853974 isoform X2 [Odontomachus brunneus]
MPYCMLLLSIAVATQANVYLPSIKEEHMLTDTLLRELIIDQLGNEFADAPDPYFLEYPEKAKELPLELPADYDGIDTLNPNPSIRDQEYLQHSTLWSHQRVNNNKGNDRHRIQSAGLKGIKDEKTENPLPAYCTPPNPCPVGYTSENNCLTNFENTAAFSRDYQSAQDCMCDTEHMLECSGDSGNSNNLSNMHISNSDFNQIVEQFQEENPFFQGEKLPIAAKKGIHVID